MDMIFDTATGQLAIEQTSLTPWGAPLRAVLKRHGQVIDLTGVQMRLTVTADGDQVFDLSLPPEGVRYRRTDQDLLAAGRVAWLPDQQISVSAWCRTRAGEDVTAQADFTVPRPPQPYPSWGWADGAWHPPVAVPDGGGFVWNETAQQWDAAEN